MEVTGEGNGIALLGVLEVPNWPPAEVETKHGADPVEGEWLALD